MSADPRDTPGKEALRREVRAKLQDLPIDSRMARGAAVEANVWRIPEIRSAGTILLYASMGSEVPTDSIASEAWRRGVRVIYPRCLPETAAMSLHVVDHIDDLRTGGSYGIREPYEECPVVDLDDIDVAFMPGLAWDRSGGRLGRGAGYYDRLFAQHPDRPARCGLFFGMQEVERVPMESWDRPLHLVVTESEVVRIP